MNSIDVAVIGGGIVGLALADAWLAAHPGSRVVVFDKEDALAAHASGRNSGVLHAGFYYAPDSLKAQLTRRGNQMLRAFCAEREVGHRGDRRGRPGGIHVRESGKVVVTTSPEQLPQLDELYARGQANGVPLEMVDEAGLRELEPLARTHERALWSPSTAVADPVAVVEALAARVRERGGEVRLGTPVIEAGPGWIRTPYQRISVGHMINAAGLYADRVAHWFGVGGDYAMLPFKGLYWYSDWPAGQLQRHVYPVPDPRNPFLGVHLTVTVDGRAKVGPTAIPSLWREDYGGMRGVKPTEMAGIAKLYPRFVRSPHHDVPGLIRTELPKYSRRYLVKQARALVPSVRAEDFRERGRVGVRAQLLHVPTGKLEMDFVVRPGERSTHVLNAVSPAWTSSLAMAEWIVERIEG